VMVEAKEEETAQRMARRIADKLVA
jgi:hypothetical protein